MGVINNLIEIRRKFKSIVGANWDGTTIADYIAKKPLPLITAQPSSTASNIVNFRVNVVGTRYTLQKFTENVGWSNVGSFQATASKDIGVYLTAITETSVCRIAVDFYGSDTTIYSNEFTVTRTGAQTTSATPKSKGADIFTESEVDSIDVVKENIEKE